MAQIVLLGRGKLVAVPVEIPSKLVRGPGREAPSVAFRAFETDPHKSRTDAIGVQD